MRDKIEKEYIRACTKNKSTYSTHYSVDNIVTKTHFEQNMEKSKIVSKEDDIVLYTHNDTYKNLSKMLNQKLHETDPRSEISKDSEENMCIDKAPYKNYEIHCFCNDKPTLVTNNTQFKTKNTKC